MYAIKNALNIAIYLSNNVVDSVEEHVSYRPIKFLIHNKKI